MDEAQSCVWGQIDEENDGWRAACNDDIFVFNDDGPEENQFRFCPWCGKRLVALPWRDVWRDEGDDDEALS